jgi:hypothetical protein
MTHDKELTKSMVKALMVFALLVPILNISWVVLLTFPFTWLLFQGIYNLEGIDNDTR